MNPYEVMKLALWNRLKQKRPQRANVTTAELQEFFRMEARRKWVEGEVGGFDPRKSALGRCF